MCSVIYTRDNGCGELSLEGAGSHFYLTESKTFWYNRNQLCHICVMAVLRVAGASFTGGAPNKLGSSPDVNNALRALLTSTYIVADFTNYVQ